MQESEEIVSGEPIPPVCRAMTLEEVRESANKCSPELGDFIAESLAKLGVASVSFGSDEDDGSVGC